MQIQFSQSKSHFAIYLQKHQQIIKMDEEEEEEEFNKSR